MSKSSPFRTRLLADRNNRSRGPLVRENGQLLTARRNRPDAAGPKRLSHLNPESEWHLVYVPHLADCGSVAIPRRFAKRERPHDVRHPCSVRLPERSLAGGCNSTCSPTSVCLTASCFGSRRRQPSTLSSWHTPLNSPMALGRSTLTQPSRLSAHRRARTPAQSMPAEM
jgi:hypothetical protein